MRSDTKAAPAGRRSTRSRCRLTRDQLIRQVIQGGGNMPAYGKNLNPAEVDALVTFLETLHPPHIAPARDSKEPAVPTVTPRSSAPSP